MSALQMRFNSKRAILDSRFSTRDQESATLQTEMSSMAELNRLNAEKIALDGQVATKDVEIARLQVRVSTLEATFLSYCDKKSLRNNLRAAMRARDRARAEVTTAEDEADEAGRRAVRTAR